MKKNSLPPYNDVYLGDNTRTDNFSSNVGLIFIWFGSALLVWVKQFQDDLIFVKRLANSSPYLDVWCCCVLNHGVSHLGILRT